MDREVHGIISKAQEVFDDNADTKSSQHGIGIIGMRGCIQGRFRWSIDARKLSDLLHFKETTKSQEELCNE
jgi:hypothetical protein